MQPQRHILVIEDVSCASRVATLVAAPVLCCAGLRVSVLPTALLSTHTGYGQVFRQPLDAQMQAICAHWQTLGLLFDAVYVGYLAAPAQFALVQQAIGQFLRPQGRVFVDPVMGDHGQRYSFCTPEFVQGFRHLAARADVIFPNLTEAALLMGHDPQQADENALPAQMQAALKQLGAQAAVITGVRRAGQIGAAVLAQDGAIGYPMRPEYGAAYPGTGDLFASCVVSGVMRGLALDVACEAAVELMDRAFAAAAQVNAPAREGVPFEPLLGWFASHLHGLLKGN